MTQDDAIAELLIRWEEAWEHGEDLAVETLCAGCPEHREELARRIALLKALAWVKTVDQPTDETSDGLEPPARPEFQFRIPETLGGRYRIDTLIAEGGQGRVFGGYDPELERPVALKIPRLRTSLAADRAEVLVAEARKLARLRHPGIVAVHDVGRHEGEVFFVSDLIDGENLADRMARTRPSTTEAVRVVAEVADALAFAHAQGFVHRDIKPANILIDHQGKALITDFGIAATAEELSRGRDVTSGTLAYMAPEQVAGEVQLIDPRTDVYALGVVLYEWLAGRSPYQARTPIALREQILFRQPLPLASLRTDISPELEALVMSCLAKHPADRPSTAGAVAEALRGTPVRARLKLWPKIALPLAMTASSAVTAGAVALWYRSQPGPSGYPLAVTSSVAAAEAPLPKVPPASAEELSRPAIDLLRLIEPDEHSVGPAWTRDGDALVSPRAEYARIMVPYHPPRSYILRVVVRRVHGIDMVAFGLRSGPSQVTAIFDTGPGMVSGLALLDTVHLNNERNETRLVKGLIPMDQPMRFECVVRESGIHVEADGETIIDWKGAPERLSLPEDWAIPKPEWLFVGAYEGTVRFETIELIPLGD